MSGRDDPALDRAAAAAPAAAPAIAAAGADDAAFPPLDLPPQFPAAPSLLGRRIWLVTFTDLVSLLLAFFILIFAMTEVRDELWQSTVDSLTRSLDPRAEADRVPTADRTVDREIDEPASDLDYLAAVLAETLSTEPALAGASLIRAPDALVVALPGSRADPGPRDALIADPAMLAALGGVLRNIGNPVIMIARTIDPRAATAAEAWSDAIAHAEAATAALRRGGYGRPVAAQGRVFADADGPRIEIALLAAEDRR